VSLVGHASDVPLGIVRDTIYREELYELHAGDVVVLMTDGVLEAIEPDLRSMSTVSRFLGEASEGAADVHRFLLEKLDQLTAGTLGDDMTLVAVEATHELSNDLRDYAQAS